MVGPELRATLSNMMNNSIKAGAKNIKINLEIEDQKLKVLVFDDGKGIPQDIQKDIFDRDFTKGKEKMEQAMVFIMESVLLNLGVGSLI